MKKEFNLTDYHTGKYDVVTRDGRHVQILKTDVKNRFSIAGIILVDSESEYVCSWTDDGHEIPNVNNDGDLFLISKPKKLYLVHFIDCRDMGLKDIERYRVKLYVKKEDADRFVKHCAKDLHYVFLRIEEVEGEVDKELL